MLSTRLKRGLIRTFGNPRAFGRRPFPAGTDPAALAPDAIVPFRCNLCGTRNAVALSQLGRETPSCAGCGSTVRFRAMAHLLTGALFGGDAALADLPRRKDLVGIGLSDAHSYAMPLTRKFQYTNTFFHIEPRVDIADVPPEMSGRYDFLIASDVFEHVAPPVSRAFMNARRILKPGGVFVFTVPFTLDGDTVEHFPNLHDFTIVDENGSWALHNRTADGRDETFTDLVFHGGPGTTLEMRIFSRPALEQAFAQAGFSSLRIAAEPCLAHGIVWHEPWSVPMVARA
jgi:SAM-dependent methyltransferase